jgi:hypothetical protein
MIFVAKNIYVFVPNFCMLSYYAKLQPEPFCESVAFLIFLPFCESVAKLT